MKNAQILGLSPYLSNAVGMNNSELDISIGGNTGNLLFAHAISLITNASTSAVAWESAHQSTEDVCFVVPLANQLNVEIDLAVLAEDFRKARQNIIGIGLGAQSASITDNPRELASQIPEGTREWLQAMKERAPSSCPNISMRGRFSLEVAKSLYDCNAYIVAGCPSNFISQCKWLGSLIIDRLRNPINRIAVAAGAPHFAYPDLESSLARIVQETEGIYICQHPIELLALGDKNLQVPRDYAQLVSSYLRIGTSPDDLIAWMRRYASYFLGASDWIHSMEKYDLVVGMRIHGVMAGIQAGIPGLCICIDSRTQELCETMQIPWVSAREYISGITTDDILSIVKSWDWMAYDRSRHDLCQVMSDFLDQNQVVKSEHLQQILS
jgi:hypothetical protein